MVWNSRCSLNVKTLAQQWKSPPNSSTSRKVIWMKNGWRLFFREMLSSMWKLSQNPCSRQVRLLNTVKLRYSGSGLEVFLLLWSYMIILYILYWMYICTYVYICIHMYTYVYTCIYVHTGSFIIPVVKFLVIAPRFWVLLTFHAYCRLTRYSPFDNICLLIILMAF